MKRYKRHGIEQQALACAPGLARIRLTISITEQGPQEIEVSLPKNARGFDAGLLQGRRGAPYAVDYVFSNLYSLMEV